MILPAMRYLGADLAQTDVQGLRITHTRYEADQIQPWHGHERPNFHFLLGGQFVDESRELGAQTPELFSLVFHPAESMHRCVAGPAGRRGLNIEPSKEWLSKYELVERDLGPYRIKQNAGLMLSLVALGFGNLSTESLGDALFEALFVTEGDRSESSGWFQKLEALLDQDEQNHWSLSRLAAEVSVHPVHLARVFRRQYGLALTPYLQQARLLKATRKLASADCLATVAVEAGYSDQAHFSRAFKSWFGISPSEARNRLQEVSIIQA